MAGLMMGNYMVTTPPPAPAPASSPPSSTPTPAPAPAPASAPVPASVIPEVPTTTAPVAGTTAATGITLGGYSVVAPSSTAPSFVTGITAATGITLGGYSVVAPISTAPPPVTGTTAATGITLGGYSVVAPSSTAPSVVAGTTAATGTTLGGHAVVAPSSTAPQPAETKAPIVFKIRGLAAAASNSTPITPAAPVAPIAPVIPGPIPEVKSAAEQLADAREKLATLKQQREVQRVTAIQPSLGPTPSFPSFAAPAAPIQAGQFYRPAVTNNSFAFSPTPYDEYRPGWNSAGYTPLDWKTGRRINNFYHSIYPTSPPLHQAQKKKEPTTYGLEQIRVASLPVLPFDPYASPVEEPKAPGPSLSDIAYATLWILFQVLVFITTPVLAYFWRGLLRPILATVKRIFGFLREVITWEHFLQFMVVYIVMFWILPMIGFKLPTSRYDESPPPTDTNTPLYIIYIGRKARGSVI